MDMVIFDLALVIRHPREPCRINTRKPQVRDGDLPPSIARFPTQSRVSKGDVIGARIAGFPHRRRDILGIGTDNGTSDPFAAGLNDVIERGDDVGMMSHIWSHGLPARIRSRCRSESCCLSKATWTGPAPALIVAAIKVFARTPNVPMVRSIPATRRAKPASMT